MKKGGGFIGGGNTTVTKVFPGTLRDWFAGQAMQAIVTNQVIAKMMSELKGEAIADAPDPTAAAREFQDIIEFPAYAKASYAIADAMLAEREKGHERE